MVLRHGVVLAAWLGGAQRHHQLTTFFSIATKAGASAPALLFACLTLSKENYMSQQNIVKFATFGPNRGLSLYIGTYQFVDGICEVLEQDVSSASRILTRYHDVCYEHELPEKIAEYDAAYQNQVAAKSTLPVPESPKNGESLPEKPQNPESEQSPSKPQPDAPVVKEPADGGAADADAEKKANGKKQNGKS